MAKKDKKQKHAKKRKEARKRQKAKLQSQPKLLRKDPALKEALDHRYPLVTCLINKDWQESKFANVYIIRDAPSGLVLSTFLIDIAGIGLKDAIGDYGLTAMEVEEIQEQSAANDNPLISCDLGLIADLVYGAIIWAQKWKFKLPKDYAVWLKLLPPVDQNDIRLDRFGEDGKPALYLDEDDLDQVIDKKFDPQILKQNLAVYEDSLPPETLDRIGNIKSTLIAFSQRSEFIEAFEAAAKDRFGEKNPESEFEWINFQDWFVLQHKLDDGKTVAQRFIENYKNYLSKDVHLLLQEWETVIEGLFEIKECNHDKARMKNLINEREYTVYATSSQSKVDLRAGYFVTARIVPAMGFHVFSGAASVSQADGSLQQRAAMYKTALELQMENPAKAFHDNVEKLQKSRDQVREQYEDFVNQFGADEVFGNGREILSQYQSFFDYQVFQKVNPDTGLTPAAFYEKDTGETFKPPIAQLPEDVLESEDVGMLCDPEEGLSFLIQYRQFLGIFENPAAYLGRFEAEDLVMEYLESESVSDIPFRKAAQRFPDNFKTVLEYLGDHHGIESVEIDDLMREFKPHTVNKLPTTVAILDSEMTRLAKLADKKTGSEPGRLTKLWQKIKKKP
ncbi:MAG: hypothetical protein P8X90_04630 [Desulfobacterales bacterium]